MTDIDFNTKVKLGRTGLMVSRLGVGSSYGVSGKACLDAFDKGVNYFFYGSVRTPAMASAIRHIAKKDRDQLVVVLQCYVRSPFLAPRSIEKGLKELGVDYADVLLLGWYDRKPGKRLLNVIAGLKEKGRFKHLAISSHNRPVFQKFIEDNIYDVFHIRYNAAHTGAEQDVFPYLPEDGAPGIVAYTNTRWGSLLMEKNMPQGERPPAASECYRFAISNPNIDVAICGPASDEEMKHALTALSKGPMDESEMSRMRAIGKHVHSKGGLMALLG